MKPNRHSKAAMPLETDNASLFIVSSLLSALFSTPLLSAGCGSDGVNPSTADRDDDTDSDRRQRDRPCPHTCMDSCKTTGSPVKGDCPKGQVCCERDADTSKGGGVVNAHRSDAGPTPDSESQTVSNSGPTISNLTIAPNPTSVLSAHIRWTTDSPADSTVQFGEGAYQLEVGEDETVTDHHALIIGLHAETRYQIKIISANRFGTSAVEKDITTASLPPNIPEGSVDQDVSESQPGWTLVNIFKGSGRNIPASTFPAAAVMYDHDGRPVWYRQHGTAPDIGGAVSTDFFPDSNTVLVGPTNEEPPREYGLDGTVLWEGPDPSPGGGVSLTHHADKLSNGNYLLLKWERMQRDAVDAGATDLTTATLEEVTPKNEVVWQWRLPDHLELPPEASGDYCHGNSAIVRPDRDEVYFSCRWLGIIKTTYDNPTLIYHLPASYHEALPGNLSFHPENAQFTDIHDPEVHEDNTLLVFDNGGWDRASFLSNSGSSDFRSRVVEYAIDEAANQAALIWEFPGDISSDDWFHHNFYMPFWGDADRLENNNVLFTASVIGTERVTHLFEVTRAGKVVWDFTLPMDHGCYRAQRLSPPLLTKLPEASRTTTNTTEL